VEVHILGPTEVVDGGVPVPLPTGRARSLLGLLALKVGEVVSADRLIDEMWGEFPPPTVHTALQGLVYNLRKRLEPQRTKGEPPMVLLTRPPGYLLDLAPEEVDSNRFRRMIAEPAKAPPERAAELLRRALSLWRGPALADFFYEPFAQAEIAELEELRLATVERRIEADLVLGRHRELVGELEGLVGEHPLREALRGHLMLALYRSGRQAEALRVFADLRSTLIDEMGLNPSGSLQRVEELILRQDVSLDLGPVSSSQPAIGEERWLPEERRIVTVLAVDVTASTNAGEPLDTEVSQRILNRYFRRAAAVVKGHRGSVEGTTGDTLVGIFGLPAASEDDALRAVRAAVDLRHLLAATNNELAETGNVRLSARTGIETGEVIVGEAATDPTGGPLRGAGQLHHSAEQGEILIGEATRLLVGRAALSETRKVDPGDGNHRAVWRVLDLMPGVAALPLTLEAPMVDREVELSELRAAYERVADEGKPHRLVVLGEPGIGKSRLTRELASMVGSEARVLTGHCPAYGEGNTFWPLREIVSAAAGRVEMAALLDLLGDENDAERVAKQVMAVTGSAESAGPPGALFPMVRRFFEALARHRPVVLVLEDLHWAEPTFLELIDYLTASVQGPLFLLCMARPELLEDRADWVQGDRIHSLVLGPLGPEESRRLASSRLGGRMVPAEVLSRLLDNAQGNPLFVEQLVATIGEEGDFSVPATVQALLAARIDRLGPAERDLIRSASVLGHRFPVAALISLLPELARRHAPRHLHTLQRKDLMLRGADTEQGESGFRHVLIQQAAYRSMTMQTRAKLHEQAADWMEAEAGGDRTELEEVVGYHLERAYEYQRELGDLADHTRRLAIRAGERLAGAGLRAFGRFDAAGAENLLGRATRLLPTEHRAQWEVSYRLAEAYETMGRHGDALDVLSDLLERTPEDADTRQLLELEQVRVRLAIGPDPMTLEEIREQAMSALAHYEATGDEASKVQALFVLAELHLRSGRMDEMKAVARRGLSHADRTDDARAQLGARRMMATALEVGPSPVSECIQECEDLAMWRGTENPAVLPILARLLSMVGEFDRGRDLITRAEVLLRERTRARRPLVLLRKRHAEVETLAGDLGAAEYQLRQALQLSLDMEGREETAVIAALLSRVLSKRGAVEEAAEMAELSRAQAPSESVTPQSLWRSTRALSLAARGKIDDGTRLAQTAIDLVPATMLDLRADLHVDLAQTLMAGEHREAAGEAIDDAITLYERKGNLVAASQAGLLVEVVR